MTKFLHIFAQEQWHSESFIVGNTESLIALRDAIDDAIKNNCSKSEYFVGDGEGFEVYIIKEENPDVFRKLEVPYTDEMAKEDWKKELPIVQRPLSVIKLESFQKRKQ